MTILDTIVEHKRIEILLRKQKRPLSSLADLPHYRRKPLAIELPAGGRPGIIAEFKRKSPSKGYIRQDADPIKVAEGYERAGATAMSILTDRDFFGGSLKDLSAVRKARPGFPLLRKDFIIDPYQVHEASAYGADIILLIAAILERSQVAELCAEARSMGLRVLFEVHDERELEKYDPRISYVGVNNRDLRNFRVDTDRSLALIGQMPEGVVAVSESGISREEEIRRLHEAGFSLFLVGEAFMKEEDPGMALSDFMKRI